MKKRMLATLLSLLMLLSVVLVGLSVSASTNGKTADQAIAWCNSNVGSPVGYDATVSPHYQCVGLIKEYCNFLGVTALNAANNPNNGRGNAYAYMTPFAKTFFAKCGWAQIQGAQPRKGDILLWSGGPNNIGHVAIYESDSVTYHQNWLGHQYVEKKPFQKSVSWTQEGTRYTNTYWGVIRPDFGSVPPDDDIGKPMTSGAGQTIPDGDYWIASGVKQDYFLDVPGDTGNIASKTNVQAWQWGNNMPGEADVYHFQYQNNGFYKIIHKSSGLALDVYGAELKAGTNVWLFTNYEHDAQLWSVSTSDGGYKIQSKCNSWFLDVTGATYANGTNIQVWKGNDSVAQKFGLIPYKPNQRPLLNGVYTFRLFNDRKWVVDSQGYGDYSNNTNIQLWEEPTDDSADKYRLEYAGDGYYYIYENGTGLCMEAVNNSESFLKRDKNVQLYQKSNNRGQLWMITQDSNGSYRFWNKLSGYCLDLNSAKENRANFLLYPYHAGYAQFAITLQQTDISKCTVTISPTTYIYDGTAKTPSVTVKNGNTTLKSGTDYTVAYSNNVNAGTATATITGKGNYKGSVQKTFTITNMIVVLDKTNLTLLTNQSQKLNLSGVPSGASVTWTSSNPAVATVDSNGNVTAKTYGKTTVTAAVTAGSQKQTKTCTVQTRFYDVPDESVSGFNQIYWAADKGITKGYNDGEYFGPTKECTRQEFAIFLWRTMGQPEPKGNSLPFKDTNNLSGSAKKAVAWASEKGIIVGFEDGTFRPNDKVTREQVVIMLWRNAGKPSAKTSLSFSDTKNYNKTSTSYKAMSWACEKEIIYGFDDNTFRPKANSKRNQIVIMLYRYVNN